jgi:hypothetical protein
MMEEERGVKRGRERCVRVGWGGKEVGERRGEEG